MAGVTILTRCYEAPPVDKREVLRYAGVRDGGEEHNALIEECISEMDGRLTMKVCYSEYPVRITDTGMDLGFMSTDSRGLKKNLEGCERVIVFGATVGLHLDRLIARYTAVSPVKALFFQAIGAERIEALCDMFCEDMAREASKAGYGLRPRFSPGYGDLPIDTQKEIFAVLDLPRRLGVTLNESLLMSPSKSVTAIAGVFRKNLDTRQREM